MIEMALHCADISNPAKPIACYQKWVVVVMNEFFAQGDKERDLGMNISPMFDRDNTMVSKTQGGFIDFIIKPIYAVWGEFIPELKVSERSERAIRKTRKKTCDDVRKMATDIIAASTQAKLKAKS